MAFDKIEIPAGAEKITVNADNSINVPNNPIIPYIEGDGIGVDISPVMIKVVDAAVEKSLQYEKASAGSIFMVMRKRFPREVSEGWVKSHKMPIFSMKLSRNGPKVRF